MLHIGTESTCSQSTTNKDHKDDLEFLKEKNIL